MTRRRTLRPIARLCIAAVSSGLLFLSLGPFLLQPMLPVFELILGLVQPDFVSVVHLERADSGVQLVTANIYTTAAVVFGPGKLLPPHALFVTVTTEAVHALLPPAILQAALLAWPMESRREAFARLAWGLAAVILVLCLTTPLFLAGRLEMSLSQSALAAGLKVRWFRSPLLVWMVFTEMGGRWLLPIVLATLCISQARQRAGSPGPGQQMTRFPG